MAERWCILLLLRSQTAADGFPPLDLYIGTGGEYLGAANLPLGAQSLYGALRLVPDTSDKEDAPPLLNRYAGYHYSDTYINIFSHTHVFGSGVVDYGEIGIIPVQIDDDNHLQQMIAKKHGCRSRINCNRTGRCSSIFIR
jgi:putative alpha-1,2-mannosidase